METARPRGVRDEGVATLIAGCGRRGDTSQRDVLIAIVAA